MVSAVIFSMAILLCVKRATGMRAKLLWIGVGAHRSTKNYAAKSRSVKRGLAGTAIFRGSRSDYPASNGQAPEARSGFLPKALITAERVVRRAAHAAPHPFTAAAAEFLPSTAGAAHGQRLAAWREIWSRRAAAKAGEWSSPPNFQARIHPDSKNHRDRPCRPPRPQAADGSGRPYRMRRRCQMPTHRVHHQTV